MAQVCRITARHISQENQRLQRLIQVIPPRIVLPNQAQLPPPEPVLEVLFPLDRIPNVIVVLIVHEARDVVLLREPLNHALPVLIHPFRQVTRHADVERPIGLARQDVDVAWFGQRTR